MSKCLWCLNEFEPNRCTQKHCSKKCKQKVDNKEFCRKAMEMVRFIEKAM